MNNTYPGPLRTANYSGSYQRKLTGLEHLVDGGKVLPFHIAEFWQWAYSDMLRNTNRGVLAEFVVKAALELGGIYTNTDIRSNFEPYDLVGPNIEQAFTPPRKIGRFQFFRISAMPYRGEVGIIRPGMGTASGNYA